MKRAVELSAAMTSLGIEDVKVGTGAEAAPGAAVTVHYTGTLMEGTKFDSSRDRNEPYPFVLGQRRGDRRLGRRREGHEGRRPAPPDDPARDGLRRHGSPGAGIPPNAALKFDVELLGVE